MKAYGDCSQGGWETIRTCGLPEGGSQFNLEIEGYRAEDAGLIRDSTTKISTQYQPPR
jgi:hypothetical protein